MTWTTQVSRVGAAQGRQIYQIFQNIHLTPPESSPVEVRDVLIERAPGEFCLLNQTANFNGLFVELEPVELGLVAGGTILLSHDPASGNCGCFETEAWVLDAGLPYHLDFRTLIAAELKRLLPPGDAVRNGDPLDVWSLRFSQGV
ncbi:MAG TPA: hypothetical protein VN515_06330, partial [Terriglobales bacterium]|nr:hypothetical protein [Terriglobales bacterium]